MQGCGPTLSETRGGRPMIARKLPGRRRRTLFLTGWLALALAPGCAATGRKHEADRVPDRGVIDPDQARELAKVPLHRYVIEPPDELEIQIKPAPPDWN